MANNLVLIRFSLALFALLDAAAHLFPSPSGSVLGQFWFNIEVVVYTMIATMYLLGLRRWYALAVSFSVLNVALFLLAGLFSMPGITSAPLSANVDFMHYDLIRIFSVVPWVYLIIVGIFLMSIDKGSKLDKLY